MIVVADTSVISHLVQSGMIHVLPDLFERILIPSQVKNELTHSNAPEATRSFIKYPPSWLLIQEPKRIEIIERLDPGETAAIHLSMETNAGLLLIDDKVGRKISAGEPWNLTVLGTLGLLEHAANIGRIDLHHALSKLIKSNFFIDPRLAENALARNERRKSDKR